MAVTYRSSTVATTPGAGASSAQISATVTKPAGTVSGDLMIVLVFSDTDANASFLTAPSGWSQSGTTKSVTNVGQSKVFTKVAGGAEPSTYSFGADDFSSGVFIAITVTGQDTTTPVNVAPTWNSSTTAGQSSQVAPAISPTVANCLLICGWSSANSTTASYTPASGMTEMQDSWSGWQFASADYQALTATGTTGTRTATGTAGGNGWTSVSLAIAPLVAAASTQPGTFLPFLAETR
jgi:hypothetical protein